jgi:hypothetical protein
MLVTSVYELRSDTHAITDESFEIAWQWMKGCDLPGTIILPVQGSKRNSPVLQQMVKDFTIVTAANVWKSPNAIRGAVVLAAWPARQTLEEIELHQPAEVLVLPGDPEAAGDWLKSHSARPLP